MKIRKIFPVLLGVFVVSAAALPFLNGMLLERFIHHRFVEKRSGAVEILSCDRGLFSSIIDWKLNLPVPLAGLRISGLQTGPATAFFPSPQQAALKKIPGLKDFAPNFPAGNRPLK